MTLPNPNPFPYIPHSEEAWDAAIEYLWAEFRRLMRGPVGQPPAMDEGSDDA